MAVPIGPCAAARAADNGAEIGGSGKLNTSGFSEQQQHEAASEEMTMARRPSRNVCPAFKAKVALAAIKG